MISINEGNVWVILCLILRGYFLLVVCSLLFGSVIHSDSDTDMLHGINVNRIGTSTLANWAASSVAN